MDEAWWNVEVVGADTKGDFVIGATPGVDGVVNDVFGDICKQVRVAQLLERERGDDFAYLGCASEDGEVDAIGRDSETTLRAPAREPRSAPSPLLPH